MVLDGFQNFDNQRFHLIFLEIQSKLTLFLGQTYQIFMGYALVNSFLVIMKSLTEEINKLHQHCRFRGLVCKANSPIVLLQHPTVLHDLFCYTLSQQFLHLTSSN